MQRCEKKGYVRVIGKTWNIWAITAPQFHSITLSLPPFISLSLSFLLSLPLYLPLFFFLFISLSFSFFVEFYLVLHKILPHSLFLPISSFHFFFLQLYFVCYWWLMTLSGENPWIYILIKSSLLLFNIISHNFSSSSSSSSSSYSFLLSSVFIEYHINWYKKVSHLHLISKTKS